MLIPERNQSMCPCKSDSQVGLGWVVGVGEVGRVGGWYGWWLGLVGVVGVVGGG